MFSQFSFLKFAWLMSIIVWTILIALVLDNKIQFNFWIQIMPFIWVVLVILIDVAWVFQLRKMIVAIGGRVSLLFDIRKFSEISYTLKGKIPWYECIFHSSIICYVSNGWMCLYSNHLELSM